jgi:hypothetical protein
MNGRFFSLKPFRSTVLSRQFSVTGNINLNSGMLVISYSLNGPLTNLIIPEPVEMLTRRENLWEGTCLEFFLALQKSKRYWEFNLSPAGHWNIYSFSSYRKGMHAEPAIESLPFIVRRSPEALHLLLEFNLTGIIPVSDHIVEAGIAAVLKPVSGDMIYWALTHPAEKADFHRRDSFIIELNL